MPTCSASARSLASRSTAHFSAKVIANLCRLLGSTCAITTDAVGSSQAPRSSSSMIMRLTSPYADFGGSSNISERTSRDTELYCAANWNRYVRVASSLSRRDTASNAASRSLASPGSSDQTSSPKMNAFARRHSPFKRHRVAAMMWSRTFSGGPLNAWRS